MRLLVVFACLFVSSPAFAQNWWVAQHHKNAELVYIIFGAKPIDDDGYETFSAALKNVPFEKKLAGVNISKLFDWNSQTIQQQLAVYYHKHHLQKFISALKQVDPAKNPDVLQLERSFGNALLNTDPVMQLNTILNTYNYQITGVTFEKFSLTKRGKAPHFTSESNWVLVY